MQYVILNPDNGLYWSSGYKPLAGSFVSERSGQYSVYSSAAVAERAIRRTQSLRGRNCTVVPEPAHERALRVEEAKQV